MSYEHVDELKAIIASTRALISHLSSSLGANTVAPSFGNKAVPNALALSSTAASLIKAQTTKLSLLVINKPFTPSAICKVLKTTASECIPALVMGLQVAESSHRYPKAIQKGLSQNTSALLIEFESLLKEIPIDERGISTEQNRGRDVFANTGVIWAACDAIVDMGEKGAGSVAAQRADESHNLVKDAIEELKEWTEDVDNSDDDEENIAGEDVSSSLDSVDLMGAKCSKNMQVLAQQIVKVIEHVRLLYPPITKRRLKKFPLLTAKTRAEELPTESSVTKLNSLSDELYKISEETDEVAGCLYDQDESGARQQVVRLGKLAQNLAELAVKTWKGEDDELSEWLASKWTPSLRSLIERSSSTG